ncbi:hypothetical protein J2P12_02770 [Candidatus Bathyarchaeota archaeon]|nr:hypothetical protein [Candidatus Bathyarchaeota archaeon]
MIALPKSTRSRIVRTRNSRTRTARSADRATSEEAIKAGEQIALAAFASGLKLAAAFGTVAAKTAGLALASLASGADKFSELIKEEALRAYGSNLDGQPQTANSANSNKTNSRRRKRPA